MFFSQHYLSLLSLELMTFCDPVCVYLFRLIKRTLWQVKPIIAFLCRNSVVTRSDSTEGQHPGKTKAEHESVFLEMFPEDDINVWLELPLAFTRSP